MIYKAFWVSGERDGEELFRSDDLNEVIKFARKFWDEHEDEFDPCFGGVGIDDENNNPVEW